MEKKKKSHKHRKFRYKKILFPVIALFIITAVSIAGFFIYTRNGIGVNKGTIGYCMRGDTLQISWMSASNKTIYRFSRYDEKTGDYIFCGEYAGGMAELTDVEQGRELVLKMQGVRTINVFGQSREILGEPRILTIVPEELDCPVLAKTADTEKRSMKVTWDASPDNRYQVYLMNEEGTFELYTEIEDCEIVFSEENCAELSGREQVIGVAVRAIRRMDDHMLYGEMSGPAMIKRADLMEDEIYLTYTNIGERQYTLSWQESKGDWYELQEWSFRDKEWIGRQVYQWTDTLSYDTGSLPSCTEVRFRVITYNDMELRDKQQYAAEPSEVSFRTELSPVYCTVWPLTALNISEDASGKNSMGQIPAGKALCVLEETEGRFLVRYEDEYGYVDSRYCLIDLGEYLGNLCMYNITNSYSSVFRVHGYEIPEVTDSVVKGYENIHMKNGDMLVPYLYPCAQKLYEAALHAQEDGYILCIYDAFRPNEATRYLYDTTETILDKPVPEEESEVAEAASGQEEQDELTEKINIFLEKLSPDATEIIKRMSDEALIAFYILPQELLMDMSLLTPEILDENSTAAVPVLTPEDLIMLQSLSGEDIPVLKELPWEELEALKYYLENVLTYRKVMTDNRFRLGSFLAQSVSTHNRGIALDLTLASAATGEELEMQSDMHDLSWYSILSLNNKNADLLAFYMKGAGYNDLSSEWWHFQDDETRNRLNLGYMEKGISPEGWKKDDLGWKYRLADGSCYCAETVMIDKKERTFNEEGYLIEE